MKMFFCVFVLNMFICLNFAFASEIHHDPTKTCGEDEEYIKDEAA